MLWMSQLVARPARSIGSSGARFNRCAMTNAAPASSNAAANNTVMARSRRTLILAGIRMRKATFTAAAASPRIASRQSSTVELIWRTQFRTSSCNAPSSCSAGYSRQ